MFGVATHRWAGGAGARAGRAPFIGFTCFVCMLMPSMLSLRAFMSTAITLPDSPGRRQSSGEVSGAHGAGVVTRGQRGGTRCLEQALRRRRPGPAIGALPGSAWSSLRPSQ